MAGATFREDRGMKDADERKVAVTLLIIQAIANHKCIRHLEADVLKWYVQLSPSALVEQYTDVQVRRAMREEVIPEVV